MSEVKRYKMPDRVRADYFAMKIWSEGETEVVAASDYDALEAERDTLQTELAAVVQTAQAMLHRFRFAISDRAMQKAMQDLDHVTQNLPAAARALLDERSALREALQGIIDIGKRDLTNLKYDGFFESARAALRQGEKEKP